MKKTVLSVGAVTLLTRGLSLGSEGSATPTATATAGSSSGSGWHHFWDRDGNGVCDTCNVPGATGWHKAI